jgi:hypothetical protein
MNPKPHAKDIWIDPYGKEVYVFLKGLTLYCVSEEGRMRYASIISENWVLWYRNGDVVGDRSIQGDLINEESNLPRLIKVRKEKNESKTI